MIGGMSWESSKVYYEYSNKIIKTLLGNSHSCKTIMLTVDFAEIEKLTFSGNWEAIGNMMADCARRLEAAGADIIILCTNTIHLVSNYITEVVDIPFLHIAEATAASINNTGLQKVALLGTRFTMEKDFYTKILRDKYGLEVITPSLKDREIIHDIIYNELVSGVFLSKSKQTCIEIIQRLKAKGAEGIIMGCTELPLLVSSDEFDIPSFDTTRIHMEAAIKWALE